MSAELLARFQFYLTVGFHFIFVPLTIGLAWFNVYFMFKYLRTKDQYYKDVSWFWNKVFLLGVVMGIPTGVLMEFQFGLNWAEYSRYVGEVFGPALAMEVIFAFFMESVFLGILFTGWNSKYISEKVLWIATVLVAIGTTLSAFFILSANSWMHTPAGFSEVNGKIVLDDLMTALFNPSFGVRFLHTMTSCLILGAFVLVGISSWYLLKDKHPRFAKESFSVGIIVLLVTTVLQGIIGHYHTVQVFEYQPAKFAAFEGIFTSTDSAPMIAFALITSTQVLFSIPIPFITMNFALGIPPDAIIQGLDVFAPDIPNVLITFYSYHFMVYIGTFFGLFALVGLYLRWKKNLFEKISGLNKWFLRIGVLAIPLPWIAIQLGWISTEVGRQPWIVQGYMKTSDAVSKLVPAEEVLISILLFILIFILLFIVWLFLNLRLIKEGPKFVKKEVPTE